MQTLEIAGKRIYIVDSHNEVLEAWENCPGLNILSLDYHTDTREAFGNYSYWRADSEAKAGRCGHRDARQIELRDQKIRDYLEGRTDIKSINDNLRHDEHLDFAVRTDLINKAFILARNRNENTTNPNVHISGGSRPYKGQRIIEYSPLCIPGSEEVLTDSSVDDALLSAAAAEAELFEPAFFRGYALDLDCDYFNSEKSLNPGSPDIFRRLIRNAAFITIAREEECVKICRMKGSNVDSEMILGELIAHIKRSF